MQIVIICDCEYSEYEVVLSCDFNYGFYFYNLQLILTLLMKKIFGESNIRTFAIILCIFMILPFLILSIFAHPSADDFFYSEKLRVFGFWDSQMQWYNYWTGKFFSTAVLSYSPLFFRSIFLFAAFILVMILLFFYMLYLLISELSNGILSVKEKMFSALLIFFLYLYGMPAVAQGFYWLTAVGVYHLSIILLMVFLIMYVKMQRKVETKRTIYMVVLPLVIIAVIGSSEIGMMVMWLLIGLLVIRQIVLKKKIDTLFLLLISSALIATYFVVAAPGNSYRGEYFPDKHNFLFSVITASKILSVQLLKWLFLTPLLPVTILLYSVLKKLTVKLRQPVTFKIHPAFPFIILIASMFLIIFVTIWSTGKEPFARTLNVVYFLFLTGFIFSIFNFIRLYGAKLKFNSIPHYVYIICFALIILYLPFRNNIRNAYADLILGTAYEFSNELNQSNL